MFSLPCAQGSSGRVGERAGAKWSGRGPLSPSSRWWASKRGEEKRGASGPSAQLFLWCAGNREVAESVRGCVCAAVLPRAVRFAAQTGLQGVCGGCPSPVSQFPLSYSGSLR